MPLAGPFNFHLFKGLDLDWETLSKKVVENGEGLEASGGGGSRRGMEIYLSY